MGLSKGKEGAGFFHFAVGPSLRVLERNQTDADIGQWLTVGPTGSGADIISTVLDVIPPGARGVRLNLWGEAWSNNFGAQSTVSVYLKEAGSPIEPSYQALLVNSEVAETAAYGQNTVDVPLDASRRFAIKWHKTGANMALYIFLEGWYA